MTATNPRAVLLDLDDTIIDYGGSAERAWRTVCDAAARDIDGLDATALFEEVSRVREWFWSDPERHRVGRADLCAAWQRIIQDALQALGHDAPGLAARTAQKYRDLRTAAVELIPGAVDTIERLRSRGVRLGMVTNGTQADQRAKIERFDLARHFDHILIEGEFGCGKPDQRVYLACLDALGAAPESTWFVGDNLEWDVAAPQRLGLYAVWVAGARSGLPADAAVTPNRIIRTLAELV